MAELPDLTLPTVEKIYQSYVEHQGDWRRNHLGASLIGKGCERALWWPARSGCPGAPSNAAAATSRSASPTASATTKASVDSRRYPLRVD